MCNQVHSVSDLRRIRQQYLNFIKTHPPSKDNANVASMFVQFLNNNLYSIVIFFLLLENNKTMSSSYHSKMSYSCYTQYTFVLSPVRIRKPPLTIIGLCLYRLIFLLLPLNCHFLFIDWFIPLVRVLVRVKQRQVSFVSSSYSKLSTFAMRGYF